MGYRFENLRVDLSEYGDGLFAVLLHPKLQPAAVLRAQKKAAVKAAGAIPPAMLAQLQSGELDFGMLPLEAQLNIAPVLLDQLDAQDEQLAALLLEWNLPDPYEPDKVLAVPRKLRDVLERVPGAIKERLLAAIQEASTAEPDPTSARSSAS